MCPPDNSLPQTLVRLEYLSAGQVFVADCSASVKCLFTVKNE